MTSPKPATPTKEQRAAALASQLATIDQRHTAALAALDKAMADANTTAATDRAAVEAAHADAEATALRDFLARVRPALAPHVKRWTAEGSRTAAMALSGPLAELRDAEVIEVGDQRPSRGRSRTVEQLGIEFVVQTAPELLPLFERLQLPSGSEDWLTALSHVDRGIGSPVQLTAALGKIETAIERVRTYMATRAAE